MCGVAAIVINGTGRHDATAIVHRMSEHMRARGPNSSGCWESADGTVALGHRRLAILDLDERSNQPMVSADGRHVISYNGEIYNFRELRTTLEQGGVQFRTEGDTEVLLALYAREGAAMLERLRGMFAFAIWDIHERSLFVARDPYGIKPLYIGRFEGGWLVASQVKAILASGLTSTDPDAAGQAGFWLMGSVPEPHTWFRDIKPVPAGTWCRVGGRGIEKPASYWDIGEAWRNAPDAALNRDDVQEVVRGALRESIRHHLVSDVPVGVFLSGGIDSGALSGLMKEAGASRIKAITITFAEFEGHKEDEVPAARELAAMYGLDHYVRMVTRSEFERDLPLILDAMDQPSIDGINTWYAAKATAELGLKVVVSGIGGDELFYGYPNFHQIPALVAAWRCCNWVPGLSTIARILLRAQSRRTGNGRWAELPLYATSIHGAYYLRRGLFTPAQLPALMGDELMSTVVDGIADPFALIKTSSGLLASDPGAAVGQMESMLYLRNQLLRDSDWASMAHSVELRTPLVDAWLLRDLVPVLRTFGRLSGKRMLAFSPIPPLTHNLISRAKTGFGLPLSQWLHQGSFPRDMRPLDNPYLAASYPWAHIVRDMAYRLST